MSQKPPKQHFITQSYMEQWADRTGNVGVVCLFHRGSALLSPGGLHYTRNLSSPDQENRWSGEEDRAKQVLKEFREKLGTNGEDLAAAQKYLSDPDRMKSLVDFVALHHARSLAVPLQQWTDPNTARGSTESETLIRERLEDVRGHYRRCGIEVTVYPKDTPIALGAIPVFEAQDWGPRPSGTARFIMPLAPRAMICGTPDWPPGQVRVVHGSADHETLLMGQLAGVPGLYSTPYLICEPSALEQTSETALRLAEGGNWHWYAINSRIDLPAARSAPDALQTDWRKRGLRHERNQALCADPTTTHSMKNKYRSIMVEDARKTQRDLDDLHVPVCDCARLRRNREVSDLWKAVMPQTVCQEIRRQQKTG